MSKHESRHDFAETKAGRIRRAQRRQRNQERAAFIHAGHTFDNVQRAR